MAEKQSPTSPRITTLEQSIASDNPFALATFWQEIAEHGAPLIEPIEGDESHSLVTFLWKDTGDTNNVVVAGGIAGWDKLADNQMARLSESDLWYRTYRVGSDLRTSYVLSHNDPLTGMGESGIEFGTRFIPDPLNPRQFIYLKDDEIPDDKEIAVSVLELPDAPAQPWIEPRQGVAQGKLEMHRLRSSILDNERRVWIYTPPGYSTAGEPYGLLLIFDGLAYITLIPTPTILDNLLSESKIPPLVAVLPDSLDMETRSRELPCHQPFVDYLTEELIPWVREHYHVTSNPAQTIVAGSSYGGLAAAFAGLRASETFGNVLSQSGSFWWDHDPEYDVPQEQLTQQYLASPPLPVRFYLEVGLQERSSGGMMIVSNRHLRDILRLQGYEVTYDEFNGGHDYLCWRGSLADGLMKLTSHR